MTQPVAKFRAGAASSALWENEATIGGQKKTMLKASVERRYTDATGTWKSSNSFSRNEVPLAIFCLLRALFKMIEEEQRNDSVAEEVVQ